MTKHMCTVIAKNYVGFARTLCQSFSQLHPQSKCYVLIIDDFYEYIDPLEESQFEIIRLTDLGISRLSQFCFKYNITELSTAVKPYFLRYLFETRKMSKLLYLDPDILVLNPLNELYDALEQSDILLTPHIDVDYPDDGLAPNDAHIMISGIFNLGFIGVRWCENVDRFLLWWQKKLYDKCVIDHAAGYFVDQKFIDLALIFFPNILIVKEPGYNVAYWNIHCRQISYRDDGWMCGNSKLYFYHFSGFNPIDTLGISKYQNRYKLSDFPALAQLFDKYRTFLFLNRYQQAMVWPYGFGCYADGKNISDADRVAFRLRNDIDVTEDPFRVRGAAPRRKHWWQQIHDFATGSLSRILRLR